MRAADSHLANRQPRVISSRGAQISRIAITILAASLLNQGRAAAICADKVVSGAEQCDDGGICVGGPLAGIACTSEAQCLSGGACFGGLDDLRACESDDDCRMATCVRCRPVGGDGCAANCTLETEIAVDLVDGSIPDEQGVEFGTSGAVIEGCCLTIPLPLSGSVRLIAGRSVDGLTPIVIPAGGVALPRIPVSTIACACVRMPSPSTCGGTLIEINGRSSLDCTPGFPRASACPAERPCAALHGAGNAGSGFIGCDANAVDARLTHDCNAIPAGPPFDPLLTTSSVDGAGNPGEGSALLALTTAIGTVVGRCSGSEAAYGADGEFCTADDAIVSRGLPRSSFFTTGSAVGGIVNSDDDTFPLGPFRATGNGFACAADGSVDVSEGIVSSVFSICGPPDFGPADFGDPVPIGDAVVPISLAFGPAAELPKALAAPCTGDCDRLGEVTVDELIKVASIALGTEALELCSVGDVDASTEITVDEVVTAVNYALHGCLWRQ